MYDLNTQAAREAEQTSNYLQETGKYKGVFIRAEKLVSDTKGTHGIGFTFEANDKRTTRFDLWTKKANGEELMSFKALMAIMTCLRLKKIAPSLGVVEKYDYDTKKTEQVEVTIFKELMNKPIGLLLRSTEYEKMKDGNFTGATGWRLELFMVFDATSEMTASEILDKKTTAEKLPAIIASLADRPLKKASAQASRPSQQGGFNDMDDVPF